MEKFVFRDRLDILMKENDINGQQLAKELGFGKNAYNNWKHCSLPKGVTLVALADFFDVSIDYLVGRKETRK